MSPMQVHGTEFLPVITHFEWSMEELYLKVFNPLLSSKDNVFIFIVLNIIKFKMILSICLILI